MHHRIMYIMNVDWDWAKQRPHFLAQHLSRTNDVTIIFPYSWRRNHLAKNDRGGVQLYPFVRLPFGGRFALIGKFNVILIRSLARLFLKWHRPSIIWISSPELFEYLPKSFSARLIYDCMDDALAFPKNAPRLGSLMENEKVLINACSNVFCSSINLRDKLINRTGNAEKYSVVFNAFEPSAFSRLGKNTQTEKKNGQYVLGYVGTISSWLDFEALIKIVNTFISLEIHLIGPIENLEKSLPEHERIKFLGAVPHHEIQAYIGELDALMMPFCVTDLIQSVDPVKLYEYVYFDKPIVSIKYSEIEKFSDFVDFYTSHEELILIINQYLTTGFMKKYSEIARQQFIDSNTWSDRARQIQEALNGKF